MTMMSSLFSNLIKVSIPVLDNSNNVISYGFIIEFSIPNDEKKVLPFIVLNYNDLKNVEFAILCFQATKGEAKEEYKVSFDKKFIQDSRLGDYLIHPIAGVLNEAANNGIRIEYFGINAKHVINLDEPQTRSIEEVSYFVSKRIENKLISITKRSHNLIPFYGDNKDYFLIEIDGNHSYGFPVFVANEGAFYNNKDLCLGTRVLLVGIALRNVDDMIYVSYPNLLIDGIKQKFHNIFTANSMD